MLKRKWRRGALRSGLPFTLMCSAFLVLLALAVLGSRPPVTGSADRPRGHSDSTAWQAGYATGLPLPGQPRPELTALLQDLPGLELLAGGAGQTGGAPGSQASRSLFPVWDGAGEPGAELAVRFPHIPEDMLPGYGRTVYYVDYGDARFWFLNGARLAADPAAQLEWLRASASGQAPDRRIVVLQDLPDRPELWSAFREARISLVLEGGAAWLPEGTVSEPPAAGLAAQARPGWSQWTPGRDADGPPPLLLLSGKPDGTLTVAEWRGTGTGRDRLTAAAPVPPQGETLTVAGPGSTWQYHPGTADIPAFIPPGTDVTGEHPLPAQGPLPLEDWRSPAYTAGDWPQGAAPFGRTRDAVRQRGLGTPLAAGASPVYFFRHTFTLRENPGAFDRWELRAAYEDGMVVYLNGTEIMRDSVREGLVDYRSLASPHAGSYYEVFSLERLSGMLVQGENTLAVQVHGSHPDTPEFWFDLALTGVRRLEEGTAAGAAEQTPAGSDPAQAGRPDGTAVQGEEAGA